MNITIETIRETLEKHENSGSTKRWAQLFPKKHHEEVGNVILDAWLVDLEGGEFKQGRNCLVNARTKGHCCLGVMGRRFIPTTAWMTPSAGEADLRLGPGIPHVLYPSSTAYLPEDFWHTYIYPLIAIEQPRFGEFNDSDRNRFKTIAKIVRNARLHVKGEKS